MQLKTSQAIFDYWDLVRDGAPAPTRTQLKPAPISALLPELFILQWEDHGDITCRLAGTKVCTLLGRELRNRSFCELWTPRQRQSLPELIFSVSEKASPLLLLVTGYRQDYAPLKFEMVLLPLADDDGLPHRVLGSLAPEHSSSWQLLEPVDQLRLEDVQPIGGLPAIEQKPPAQKPAFAAFIGKLASLGRNSWVEDRNSHS